MVSGSFPMDRDYLGVLNKLMRNGVFERRLFKNDVLDRIGNYQDSRSGTDNANSGGGYFGSRDSRDTRDSGGSRGGSFFGSGNSGGGGNSGGNSGGGFFGSRDNRDSRDDRDNRGGNFFGGGNSGGSGGYFSSNNNSNSGGGGGFFGSSNNSGGGNNWSNSSGGGGGGFFSNGNSNRSSGGGGGHNPGSSWFGGSNATNSVNLANLPVLGNLNYSMAFNGLMNQQIDRNKSKYMESFKLLPEDKRLYIALQAMPEDERQEKVDQLEFERNLRLENIKDAHLDNQFRMLTNKDKTSMRESCIDNRRVLKKSSNLAPKSIFNFFETKHQIRSSFCSFLFKHQVTWKVRFGFLDNTFNFVLAADRTQLSSELLSALVRQWRVLHTPSSAIQQLAGVQMKINGITCDEWRPVPVESLIGDATSAEVIIQVPLRVAEVSKYHQESTKDQTDISNSARMDSGSKNNIMFRASDFLNTERIKPILGNSGLETKPSIKELQSMSESELSRVSNFVVWNKWGQIEFEEDVDLIGANLGKVIQLGPGEVCFYPSEHFAESEVPIAGEKLNKRAIVRLFDIRLPNRELKNEVERIKQKVEELGAEFTLYDPQNHQITMRFL